MAEYKLWHNCSYQKLENVTHVELKEGFIIVYESIGNGYRVKEYIKPKEGSRLEVIHDE